MASKVKGLKLGAEDYMVKPFEMLELLVRIEKVLERTGRARKVLTIRNIMVDVQSHQVLKDGIPVNLKPMEYDLFVLLLQIKHCLGGRLLKRVWGEGYLGESRTVDVHIGQLRKNWNFMMRSGRSRSLDTVWRNRYEAVETNSDSYAGNLIVRVDPSGGIKHLCHRKPKPE